MRFGRKKGQQVSGKQGRRGVRTRKVEKKI